MDKDDYRIVSSLTRGAEGGSRSASQQPFATSSSPLYSTPPTSSAGAGAARSTRTENSHPLKRSVAELLHDHGRYATRSDERQLVSQHEQSAVGAAVAASSKQMHGKSPWDEMWGTALGLRGGGGSNTAHGSASTPYAAIAPLKRWRLVRGASPPSASGTETSDDLPEEQSMSDTASKCRCTTKASSQRQRFRWRRADELVESEALLATLASDDATRCKANNEPSRGQQRPESKAEAKKGHQQETSETRELEEAQQRDRHQLAAVLRDYHLLRLCASGENASSTPTPAGAAVMGLASTDPHVRSAFGCFTFQRREYDALYEEREDRGKVTNERANGENGGEGERRRGESVDLHSYEAACKLVKLYERYGSFVAVADRWATTDARGEGPASLETHASTTALPFLPSAQLPTVDALCAAFQRITRGVMRQRVKRLEAALLACQNAAATTATAVTANASAPSPLKHSGVTPSKRSRADDDDDANSTEAIATLSSATAAAATLQRVWQHPLMVLLLQHPLLGGEDGENKEESEKSSFVSSTVATITNSKRARSETENDGFVNTTTTAVPGDARAAPPPPPPTDEEANIASFIARVAQERAQHSNPARLLRLLMTPVMTASGALDEAGERMRRACLSAVLTHESAVNVPYQRTAAAYLSLVPRAVHALQRFQAFVGQGSTSPRGTNHTDGEEHNSQERDTTGHLFAPIASPRTVPLKLRELPEVDPVAWRAAEQAIQQQQSEQPNHSESSPSQTCSDQNSGADGEWTRAITEVFQGIPLTCARLVGAAQAGWLLGPPPPLAPPPSVHDAASATRQEAESRNEDIKALSAAWASANTTVATSIDTAGVTTAEDARCESATASPTRFDGSITAAAAEKLMHTVARAEVCNRAYSMLSDSVLITLPRSVPRLHREVEETLEKYLWDDAAALMDSSPLVVQELVPELRVVYTQNVLLKRTLTRLENMLEAMQKVESAVAAAGVDAAASSATAATAKVSQE